MAIQTAVMTVKGVDYPLTFDSASSKWKTTATAPALSSFNNNAGHYYPVTITATDTAGNTTVVNDLSPTIGDNLKLKVKEKIKPTITITAPSTGAFVITNKPPIKAQLRDEANGSGINITTLSLKIDTGAVVNNTSAGMVCTPVTNGYDITYTPQATLADGSHTVTINVSDNDTNTAVQASSTFKVDTVAPTLNVTNPTEGFVTNQTNLSITGTTTDTTSTPVAVKVLVNAVDAGTVTVQANGSFTKSVILKEGANVLKITAIDAAGKETIVTRNVTVNTTAPRITAVTASPNPVDCGQTYVITVEIA